MASTGGVVQGRLNEGECEPDWLPREAAQFEGERARLRCLRENASARVLRRHEGNRMCVPWPLETQERGRPGVNCRIERGGRGRRSGHRRMQEDTNIQSGDSTIVEKIVPWAIPLSPHLTVEESTCLRLEAHREGAAAS